MNHLECLPRLGVGLDLSIKVVDKVIIGDRSGLVSEDPCGIVINGDLLELGVGAVT